MKLITLLFANVLVCCWIIESQAVPSYAKLSSKQADNEQSISLNNVQRSAYTFSTPLEVTTTAADDVEEQVEEQDTMQTQTIGEPMLTGRLQWQLIQKYAGIYKQIPRVTYFTCRLPNLNMDMKHLRQLYYTKNLELANGMSNGYAQLVQREVFLKFVHIDELTERTTKSTSRRTGGVGRGVDIGGRAGAGVLARGFGSKRKSYTKSDWLDSMLKYEGLRHIVVVDLACGETSRQLLELASGKMLFNAKFHWLLIEDYWMFGYENATRSSAPTEKQPNESNEWQPIEIFMKQLNFYVNTEITLAKRISFDRFRLFDVWNPGLQYGGELNITEIGSFSLNGNINLFRWFQLTSTVLRRRNMHQAHVRVMNVVTNKNVNSSLEEYLTTPIDVHIDSMNRFNFNLLLSVKAMFNMSFSLMRSTSWGYLKNGKFDGMIGAIIRKQVDLAGSPVYYMTERHKFIDAAARTWTSRPCFIFRHPRSTKKDRIVFLQPFSNDVWLLLGLCGIATVLILWFLSSIELTLKPNNGASLIKPKGAIQRQHATAVDAMENQRSASFKLNKNESKLETILPHTSNPVKLYWRRLIKKSQQQTTSVARLDSFLESTIFYVGIICQQGLGFATTLISGRCIVITSLLFSFCIYQFYSASIVGTLLMEKPKTIRTLTDLVHSSLHLGVEDILYNRDFFLRTKDPIAMELYAKKITSVPGNSDNENEVNSTPEPTPPTQLTAKSYREILHSHETGAHAKSSEASNWLDPETGMLKVKKGRFAFHVDVATAYKIIGETFSEREICDLTEISLFPPQKTVSVMQKNSPLRKVVAYGLRRVIEAGIMSYQIKIWHSRKPPCVKQLEASDLHVDMETVSSALLVLLFGYVLTLVILGVEIFYHRMQQRKSEVNK